MFGTYFVVALVIGHLATQLREREQVRAPARRTRHRPLSIDTRSRCQPRSGRSAAEVLR